MRLFKSFEEFETLHPDIAKAMKENSGNEFIASIREQIDSGSRRLSRKQFDALQKFVPPVVTLVAGDIFTAIVDLTETDEKGISFWDPETRLRGRIEWPEKRVYEETFDARLRERIDESPWGREMKFSEPYGVRLQAKVQWTPPADPGSYLIVDAFSCESRNPRTDHLVEAKKLAAVLAGEDWPTPSSTAAARKRGGIVEHASGPGNVVEGVIFYGALKMVDPDKNIDKFWSITLEKIQGDAFRIRRHYGRNGEHPGKQMGTVYHSFREANDEALKLWDSKLLKGYKPVERAGSLECETFQDVVEEGVYMPGHYYSETSKALVGVRGKIETSDFDTFDARDHGAFDGIEGPHSKAPEPVPEPPERVKELLPRFNDWRDGWD